MRLERGRLWEARAAAYLEACGLTVLARSYRCRLGEIDLVCRDDPHLVIVEVRARGSSALCSAVDSIGTAKRRRIVLATRHLLMRHGEWHAAPTPSTVRSRRFAGSRTLSTVVEGSGH